ncbi:MAG: membrane protein insertion efficiency factor YidD [Deltaproteobacteria bacterium]|jgi:putative membrane protein insertion efficiency factor|nr:membrane protein insertion efficiency factor YidD [Deltaproteobacteria bacterium]
MLKGLYKDILEKSLVGLIRLYQILISPFLNPCCRFFPTCSDYAILAIERHGPFRGLFMAIMRLLRCHPLHPGGYDPVS